jgi:hypothetical protein
MCVCVRRRHLRLLDVGGGDDEDEGAHAAKFGRVPYQPAGCDDDEWGEDVRMDMGIM